MLLLLLGRVVLSVSASGLQKRLTQLHVPGPVVWAGTHAWMLPLALVAVVASPSLSCGPGFWRDAALAGIIDALGNLATVSALRTTDLSVFGPLNGFRPVMALGFGALFLGERVSPLGGAGVAVTVAGATFLLRDNPDGDARWTAGAWRTLGWRLSGLSLSVLASVFLKRAALSGPTSLTLAMWIGCGLPVLALAAWQARSASPVDSPAQAPVARGFLPLHATIFFVMLWASVEIFRTTLLAYSFAFFQLGMVLQVLLGALWFGEKRLGPRLACCGLMGIGTLLIMMGK